MRFAHQPARRGAAGSVVGAGGCSGGGGVVGSTSTPEVTIAGAG